MQQTQLDRRTLLKGIGLGTTAMLAGCVAPSSQPNRAGSGTESGNEVTEVGLDPPAAIGVDRIAGDPTDLPAPVDWDEPREHEIEMETVELTAEIEPGVTFDYMTFDGQVPGPMVRVRRGDSVRFRLTNPEENGLPHNIDFHAVYGPGGGAEHTTITPGQTAEIEFTAMYPGVHIYHCAVPGMDHHISAGMFGAILVEPEEGLPEVDREFYFGQHELYTKGDPGQEGHHTFDMEAMAREEPTYVVFNGQAYGFTDDGLSSLHAETDERVRVFFTNGGPNLTSSWHAIGNVWSRLYRDGDLLSDPARYVETTPVAPGTSTTAELDTPVPGPIHMVDHALSRAGRRGTLATIDVDGEPNPEVYKGDEPEQADSNGDAAQFDGWLDDVGNFDGVVDKTDRSEVTVDVGVAANGGGFGFGPAAVEISPGTEVNWRWTGDGGYHNVSDTGGAFESDLTDENDFVFAHTFQETGIYKYECTPHVSIGMKGVVVVSE